MNVTNTNSQPSQRHGVFLVGAGVVGVAIARAHIESGVSIWLLDQDETALQNAVNSLGCSDQWQVSPVTRIGALPSIEITSRSNEPVSNETILIESIAERLDLKQAFFQMAEAEFADAVLCSNTSTLRIDAIAEGISRPERFCGMHFFMPVHERSAVEVVQGKETNQSTIDTCCEHVRRIHKQSLVVNDGPGFIVNRLLSNYLNGAMLLLGRGVTADRIERAALQYGMPLSPLELIDWIGARTMFNAGRVYWQAFPNRIDPSPILPAMIKRKQFGRASGSGFYMYENGERSTSLSPTAAMLYETYQCEPIDISDHELVGLLSIPMWIEAVLAYHDGVVESANGSEKGGSEKGGSEKGGSEKGGSEKGGETIHQFDLAMRGGLGFDPAKSWLGFFDQMGSDAIAGAIRRWGPSFKSMTAPEGLLEVLAHELPSTTILRFSSR